MSELDDLRRRYAHDPVALRAIDQELAAAAQDVAQGRRVARRNRAHTNRRHGWYSGKRGGQGAVHRRGRRRR